MRCSIGRDTMRIEQVHRLYYELQCAPNYLLMDVITLTGHPRLRLTRLSASAFHTVNATIVSWTLVEFGRVLALAKMEAREVIFHQISPFLGEPHQLDAAVTHKRAALD